MLSKKFRLPASKFPQIYNKGFKARGDFGMLVSLKGETGPLFGYVVSKKNGNSVQRHRMTRRLRNISMEMTKKYNLSPLLFQYILFKYTDDYISLRNEFEKQINTSIQKWLKS